MEKEHDEKYTLIEQNQLTGEYKMKAPLNATKPFGAIFNFSAISEIYKGELFSLINISTTFFSDGFM